MAAPYAAEVGGNLAFAGVDQGIDFTGSGPVYALGSGTITRLQPSGSGWPGQGALLSYSIPSLNKYVYIAEDFVARAGLKVGDTIKQGDVLGVATGSGLAPGIETGWADAGGHAAAPFAGRSPTSLGYDFQSFVQKGVAGVVGGPGQPPPVRGATGTPGAVTRGSSDIVGAVKDVYGTIDSIPKFLGKITDPNLWIRVLEIVGGSVLFLAGLYLLTKNVGLGVPAPAPAPVKKVAAAV